MTIFLTLLISAFAIHLIYKIKKETNRTKQEIENIRAANFAWEHDYFLNRHQPSDCSKCKTQVKPVIESLTELGEELLCPKIKCETCGKVSMGYPNEYVRVISKWEHINFEV